MEIVQPSGLAGDRQLASTGQRSGTVVGLDSLRWFAALAVVISHLSTNLHPPTDSLTGALWRIISLPANGSAAVGLFFVISGFCIHLGQVATLRVNTTRFLCRRMTRIGLPLLAMVYLSWWCGEWASAALKTVLWSIYCELIYYLAYPLLLSARRRYPMRYLTGVSITISLVFLLLTRKHDFAFHYDAATALVYFPLWLSGAWMAERYRSAPVEIPVSMTAWRLGAIAVFIVSRPGNFPVLNLASWFPLALIGLYAWHYLPRELSRWTSRPPVQAFEALGRSSYSLYLGHILPIGLVVQTTFGLSYWPLLAGTSAAIALLTFCLYQLCELPAHRLARKIGARPAIAKLITA